MVLDGRVYRAPSGEIIRVAQDDGLNDEIRLHYMDRDGSPKTERPRDLVLDIIEDESWEEVAHGAVPGHVWGKAVGRTNCPECGKFLGAKDVEFEHRIGLYSGDGGIFAPALECTDFRCDGHLTYEDLKERGMWLTLEELSNV